MLGAGLSASYIVASGVVKGVGDVTMTDWGVPEHWMPFVTGAHIADLLAAFEGSSIVASAQNGHAMSPVLFPASHFAGLESLTGDGGARKLLGGAHLVEANEAMLMDIDTPDRLARLNRQTGLPHS